jgi:hypothetical protein
MCLIDVEGPSPNDKLAGLLDTGAGDWLKVNIWRMESHLDIKAWRARDAILHAKA